MKPMNYSSPYLKLTKKDNLVFSSKYREVVGAADNGAIKPDAEGCYTVILGGLNILPTSAAGAPYAHPESSHAFSNESILLRKIAAGSLMAEMDHPDRSKYATEDAFDRRLSLYKKKHQCAEIRAVWLDESKDVAKVLPPNLIWGARTPVFIMGKVKPMGPNGDLLKKQLDDPNSNVFFSMRTISRERFIGGIKYYVLDLLTGFDWVSEGGLAVSNKWLSSAINQHSIPASRVKSMASGVGGAKGTTLEHSQQEYFDALVQVQRKIDLEPNTSALRINRPRYL